MPHPVSTPDLPQNSSEAVVALMPMGMGMYGERMHGRPIGVGNVQGMPATLERVLPYLIISSAIPI